MENGHRERSRWPFYFSRKHHCDARQLFAIAERSGLNAALPSHCRSLPLQRYARPCFSYTLLTVPRIAVTKPSRHGYVRDSTQPLHISTPCFALPLQNPSVLDHCATLRCCADAKPDSANAPLRRSLPPRLKTPVHFSTAEPSRQRTTALPNPAFPPPCFAAEYLASSQHDGLHRSHR
jgi:hypothetical protein